MPDFVLLRAWPEIDIERRWRECLLDADFATHYIAPEYFREPSVAAKRPFAVLALADNRVSGVLTGHHEGRHVKSGLLVRPQLALSKHEEADTAAAALFAGVVEEGRDAEIVDVFAWRSIRAENRAHFRERLETGVIMLDLTRGPEALFRGFSEMRRRNIRKAIKANVQVCQASSRADFEHYYPIYKDWSDRKGLPVMLLPEFMETMVLTGNRRLFVARHNGTMLAGIVVRFVPGGVMEYAANSSLESSLHLRPNDLLHWRAIEWACSEGLNLYSLGGTHLFLTQFGGETLPTYRYRQDRSLLRRHHMKDAVGEMAASVMSRMPRRVLDVGRSMRANLTRRAIQ